MQFSSHDYIDQETEVAMGNIRNCQHLTEDQRRHLVSLVTFAKQVGTNTKSDDEKATKNARALFFAIMMLIRIGTNFYTDCSKIVEDKCKDCEAYKYFEKIKQQQTLIDIRAQNGTFPQQFGPNLNRSDYGNFPQLQDVHHNGEEDNVKKQKKEDEGTITIIKHIFEKPYVYIFLAFAVFSPYLTSIIEAIAKLFK